MKRIEIGYFPNVCNMPMIKALIVLMLIAMTLIEVRTAYGFALVNGVGLNDTARWDSNARMGRGLADKLQWNIEPGFTLQFAEGAVPANKITEAVEEAFGVWRTGPESLVPGISKSIDFKQGGVAVEAFPADSTGVGGGKVLQGTEISIFARVQNATIVRQAGTPIDIFKADANNVREIAHTYVTTLSNKPRSTFTNQLHNVGETIMDVDLYLNAATNWTLDTATHAAAQDLVAVLVHEIGHALGLGHTLTDTFFDTDANPNNAITIKGSAPETTANLSVRANPAKNAFTPLPVMIVDAHTQTLAEDDLGGLRYLYPGKVPEPTTILLLVIGLTSMTVLRRKARL